MNKFVSITSFRTLKCLVRCERSKDHDDEDDRANDSNDILTTTHNNLLSRGFYYPSSPQRRRRRRQTLDGPFNHNFLRSTTAVSLVGLSFAKVWQ